jgi:hypothetical protein
MSDLYIKPTKDSELYFRASIIDGTALSLADILKKVFPEPTQDIKLCVFCLQEFYKFLQISVQTKTEEEFVAIVKAVIEQNKSN